jgi:hypothetical protein
MDLDQARWDDDGGAQPTARLTGRRGKLHRALLAARDRLETEGKYAPPAGYQNVTVQHRTDDPWHDLPFDFEYAE